MADYSVTLDPFLRGIDAAQQRQYRANDRDFQNWQRQQSVTTTQNAQALDRALGEGALARMEAAQAPAISSVVATVPPPPPSMLAAQAPQMSTPPPLESVTAKPQMSEWRQPVQVETQVMMPGATFKNADMIRRVAAVPGGGKAAYDMAMADEKSATAARASLYKMLHDAKTPADVEIAVQMANEAGAGIPPNLVKSKQFSTALVQAGTVAHQLGNKDQAFKAVLGALMKGEDPAAVIGQLSGDSGFRPHGQPVVDKNGNYVFLGSDGKMHQAEIDGKAVGAGARSRAGGGGEGGSPKAIQTMEWKAKAFEQIGVAPNIARAIAANPGFASSPKAIMDQARFLKKQSDETRIMNPRLPVLTMDQAMAQAKQMMADAQRYAMEGMAQGGDGMPPQRGTPAGGGQNASLPPGIPLNAQKVGTKGGKPVYEWTDAVTGKKKRAVVE